MEGYQQEFKKKQSLLDNSNIRRLILYLLDNKDKLSKDKILTVIVLLLVNSYAKTLKSSNKSSNRNKYISFSNNSQWISSLSLLSCDSNN